MIHRLLNRLRRRDGHAPAPVPGVTRDEWRHWMRDCTAAELRAIALDESETCLRRAAARELLLSPRPVP